MNLTAVVSVGRRRDFIRCGYPRQFVRDELSAQSDRSSPGRSGSAVGWDGIRMYREIDVVFTLVRRHSIGQYDRARKSNRGTKFTPVRGVHVESKLAPTGPLESKWSPNRSPVSLVFS